MKKMRKQNKQKKWKIRIIVIWIAFLAAVSIGCFGLQRANVYEKAKTELTDQAEIISGQFAGLVDTDFYVRAALQETLISEVKAISFVLEKYDDIGKADAFLKDIVNSTGMKDLWIYDRSGNIVFGSGAAPVSKIDPDYVSAVLDSRSYEAKESVYDGDDRYWTTTYYLEADNNDLVWGVKDRWLIYAKDVFSDNMKEVVQFFDWDQVLQDISICRDGAVLAVSETDGSVLSWQDPAAKGMPVEDLPIKIAGDGGAASVDRLLEAFPQTGEVTEIEVGSVRFYATKMNTDQDLFLVMYPAQAIEEEVAGEAFIIMLPLALITGIGVLYLFCLAGSESKLPVGKLKVFTMLAVILMLIISLYLETHLVYVRMFQYTSTTVEDVMQKKNTADHMLKEIQGWMKEENLEKSRIARCAVQHAPGGKADRQYVTDLAENLEVNAVYVFDSEGKVSVTNAAYDGYVIDRESPFFALLEGTESVIRQPDPEASSGEAQQAAGVTMIDENNRVAGAVVTEDDFITMIPEDLSFEAVFQRVFLKDNTVVMAIDSENMSVRYFAQVDGSLLTSDKLSFDYTQTDAAALGLNEELIRDHFNGEMFAIDNQFFASVRRNDNAFLMVLRPLVFIDGGNLVFAVLVTAFTLIFFILLIAAAGRLKKDPEEEAGEEDDPAAKKPDIGEEKNEDDMITLLGSLVNRNKPYFEERWPSDGKKWREKTPMEKFSAAVKLICILLFALIVVSVVIAGENSVLYYYFNGNWSTGVNLYSVTSCIIYIIVLILLKEVIHKVLFLIARAVQRRGETICSLLNSFTGYVLFIAGVFIVLGTLGVNVTAMSLTAGVAGVIFGIGCQNIVADILAGIIMAFEGVARVGDFVSYNGKFGVIQTIGVRTTKLKWFSEITIVRNNEFKNYINMPGDETDRVVVKFSIDLKESLTRTESIIEQELPGIRERLGEMLGEPVKLKFRGVQDIEENGIELSFAVFCRGIYYGWIRRVLNRELLLMCERNGIRLAMPQIVINERADAGRDSDGSV